MDLLKDDRISCQEKVKKTIDKRHVNTQQENNGLSDQETQRPAEIFRHKFSEVDFNFLLFGMDPPIFSAAAELFRFLHKDDWRVCFVEENRVEPKGDETHYCRYIFCPAPAHVFI